MHFPAIFISGTSTDIGKTFISAALLSAAQRRGLNIQYWKPVQTGGIDIDRQDVDRLCPGVSFAQLPVWSYPLPASPDQAALAAGKPAPTVGAIAHAMDVMPGVSLLIEGAGGLLVPLNQDNETWRDFLAAEQLPVILVAASGLGTINHTLLTLEALDYHGIVVLGTILNGQKHNANLDSLRRQRPDHRFHAFPFLEGKDQNEHWPEACDDLLDFILAAPNVQGDKFWTKADHDHCWHPYTQHQTAAEPIPIARAKGIYLQTDSGEQLIDASASWWTNSTGHGHPRIGAAIIRQHRRLDHCIFAGATHEPASILAQRLAEATEGLLSRAFYSDNGSCAVEVALKMAAQSWRNKGIGDRQSFLFFKGAYHGDTFGAMSVGASEGFHKAFSPYLFQGKTLAPVTSHRSRLCPDGAQGLEIGLEQLEEFFKDQSRELAGVIIEPLVQGASGMNFQHMSWLRNLGRLCKEWGVPLILDEVFTGMGRLGSMFAYQRAGIEPDVVCIAKGLTGGTLPLAVTLTSETLFKTFLDQDGSKALLHGHTFTGNAIACAAALATMDVYRDERILDRVRQTETRMREWISTQASKLGLIEARSMGAVMAWELPGSGPANYFHPLAQQVPVVARRHGLLMRTLGNTMYFVPPMSIRPEELDDALSRIEKTLGDIL